MRSWLLFQTLILFSLMPHTCQRWKLRKTLPTRFSAFSGAFIQLKVYQLRLTDKNGSLVGRH
jgi:hypothetical protein